MYEGNEASKKIKMNTCVLSEREKFNFNLIIFTCNDKNEKVSLQSDTVGYKNDDLKKNIFLKKLSSTILQNK